MSVGSSTPLNIRGAMGAGFVGGGPSPILNPRNMSFHGYSGSPLRSADSMFASFMGIPHNAEDFDLEEATFEEEGDDLVYNDDLALEEVDYIVNEVASKLKSLEELVFDNYDTPAVEDEIEDDDEELKQEMSVSGGVAGYTGPLKSPENPKQFYKDMDIWRA